MSLAWFIDSLDARGGLCFASYRPMGVDPLRVEDFESTVFLNAPGFSPIALGNPLLALSAARGSFQFRLLRDSKEVRFENLSHLIDFVRRVYVGSGGGDTRGGGSGGFPPPAPVEPGDLPEHGLEVLDSQESPSSSLADGIEVLFEGAKGLEPGKACAFDMTNLEKEITIRRNEFRSPFGKSLLSVGFELLQRRPFEESIPEGRDRWTYAAGDWAQLFGQLVGLRTEDGEVIHDLVIQHSKRLRKMEWVWGPYSRIPFGGTNLVPGIERLSRLPVPSVLHRHFDGGAAEEPGPSLLDLVFLVCSDPSLMRADRLLADLFLFSVAVLHLSPEGWHRWPEGKFPSYDQLRIMVYWIKEALPRFLFEEPVEELIRRAPSLRYEATTNPPGHAIGPAGRG